ncbi:MAG: hypothetical protein AABX70_00980 [Nanoarchaeota archaeon]
MRFEEEWVRDLGQKKGLVSLSAPFIARLLAEALKDHSQAQEKLVKTKSWSEFARSKECEAVSKEVRSRLREVYGVFWSNQKREALLKSLIQNPFEEAHDKILALHTSTKERLPYYEEVYEKIFAITGKPKKILDLACGLNPIAYPYLDCKPEYLANELCESDAFFIQSFFDGLKIQGQAFAFNVLQFSKTPFADFLRCDVCFLFKALDSLEAIDWGFSEKLLSNIPTTWLVVSFPTRSLGGKKEIKQSKRSWFEHVLGKNHWAYQTFELPNEFFYVVKKT